jgi:hypothetical protein
MAEALSGVIERITFHNLDNGYVVLKVRAAKHRDLVTVVGHAATITAGEFVQASGIWINDRTHGLQLKAAFLKATAPTTLEGIEKYLGSTPPDPKLGHPGDIPKAASDWPQLNFQIYHSCIKPSFFMYDALQDIQSGRLREGVPDIAWTTEFAQLAQGRSNVYAELGTTWASTIVTFPTVAAHVLGQLLKYMGSSNIVFGSDSPWYGTPQWQIEAFWRFQIPEELRQRWGYPELTEADKRMILGLNNARIYGLVPDDQRYNPVPEDFESLIPNDLKRTLEFPGFTADNFSRLREKYLAHGIQRNDTRYGWIRV